MCWKREYYHPRAVEHIARLLEEGFQPDDLFLTLGYFPGRQPSSREAALYFLKTDFIQRLQRERKAQGVPCAYLYGLRWAADDMPPEFSIVLSRGPETVEQLRRLWPYGVVICRPLREMGPLPQLAHRLYLDAQSDTGRRSVPIRHSRYLGPQCKQRRYQTASELRERAAL